MRTKTGALKFAAALAAFFLFSACASAESAKATPDAAISSGHWAYQAIDGWARRGLLAGYRAGPFAGPQALTRFEVAALTLRAAEAIGQQYQRQGEMLAQLAAPRPLPAPSEEGTPEEAEIGAIERGPGVYPEDIAMLEKLVAEFRSELADMGTKVNELEALLASTRQRLEKVEEEARRHQISGYLQFRFSDDEAKTSSNFSLRRARLNMAGPISEKVARSKDRHAPRPSAGVAAASGGLASGPKGLAASYKIQFQLDKDSGQRVVMRDAYIDLSAGRSSRLRAGQAKLPIGYELPESSSVRLEPERALIMDRLFPDQRDIGVQWHWQGRADGPALALAVVNGTGMNASDDNDRKDVMASVNVPFSWGSAAFAVYEGRSGSGASAQDKDRLAAGLELGKKKTQLRGEYIVGRDRGEEVEGWYLRVSQQAARSGTVFLKYDVFDENTDRANDLFRRWGLGWAEELDANVRLTLAWETRRLGRDFSEFADFHGEAATVQLQAKF